MFQLGKVHTGDCVELMQQLPGGSIDLTVTSPPYDNLRKYNGYSFDFENTAKQLYRITKPGGVVVWVVGDATIKGSETGTSFKQALYFMQCGFNLHDTMIYEQAGTGAKGSIYSYWQTFEYMFVFSKSRPKTINLIEDIQNKTAGKKGFGRFREKGNNEDPHITKPMGRRTNIWRYGVGFADNSDKTGHPAVYPEKLAEDHILSWSNPGDLIFDPFSGSGTTGKMALLNNRKFLGFEISEEYTQLANNRIRNSVFDGL